MCYNEILYVCIQSMLTRLDLLYVWQAIMQLNLKEVASNLKQLDEESAQLFERLGNLRAELQEETVEFEEKKQAFLHTYTYITYIHKYKCITYSHVHFYFHAFLHCITGGARRVASEAVSDEDGILDIAGLLAGKH